jgi:nitrite reductase (NADH) small subunit
MLAPTLTTSLSTSIDTWRDVCAADAIVPFTGIAALVEGQQIAIFRLHVAQDDVPQCYAISNYDPFSKANVIARGLVGDKNGVLKVASPIYKNTFNLLTGQCLEDESVRLRTWPTRIVDGMIQLAVDLAEIAPF